MSGAMTIPASQIVSINPGVLAAAGSGFALSGLLLTSDYRVPTNGVLSFASSDDVGAYFGLNSNEQLWAQNYFPGFDSSYRKPGKLLVGLYNQIPVKGVMIGAKSASLTTLTSHTNANLQVTVDGVVNTSASFNLSTATSKTNIASLVQAAFTNPNFGVAYDAARDAFVIQSGSTGTTSTVSYASSGGADTTFASDMGLTALTGAVLSPGRAAQTPASCMATITSFTQNFATYSYLYDPDGGAGTNTNKLAFAAWNSGQNNRYLHVGFDYFANAKQPGDLLSFAPQVKAAGYSGTASVWSQLSPSFKAAFLMGAIASIDFTQLNGRTNLAFRAQSGQTPETLTASEAQNLQANGFNFYGSYATAANGFQFFYPGQVSGPFKWIDSYINQIWLNDQLQVALMQLLASALSIPYNARGYGLIRAACLDPINAAIDAGVIRPGIPLSQSQAAQVDNAAGITISDAIQAQGWYLQISPANAATRVLRGSPPCRFWYADGQSVQAINLASIEVQ